MSIRRTALRNLSLFSELTDKELTVLTALLRETHYPKNSVVFQEGEPGESLLLIAQGKVKVVLLGEQGQETILTTMSEGSFLVNYHSLTVRPDPPQSLRSTSRPFCK